VKEVSHRVEEYSHKLKEYSYDGWNGATMGRNVVIKGRGMKGRNTAKKNTKGR
jgi:hypothetical protein